MTPTNVGSTRPTDAELVKLLRNIYRNALGSPEKLCELVMVLGPTADALEAASADKTGSLHRPGCSPDCSRHHRMTNEAPYNDEPYTVSGVDYTFRFAINPRKHIGQFAAANALEAASAEPRTYGDGEARYATPEAAATDSVSVWDTFDEYDYKGATRRDVIRAVLRSVGMETQESYTVSPTEA